MAGGLEDVTPHIELSGVDEVVSGLEKIGAAGAEAFATIAREAASGDLTGIVTHLFGETAGAVAEATKAVFEFVDAQASAAETLSNLAQATGMTVPEIEGLKDAFASVGISTNGFERAIGRLAMTIGSEWASIQQSVRTSADDQEKSMMSLQDAAERVQKAYRALDETSAHSAQTAAHDALSIRETQLSLEKAQQKQRADNPFNNPVEDPGTKQRMKAAEDQLAVDRAQQSVKDAQAKQIEDSIKAEQQLQDAIKGVEKAKLAEREASERAHQQDLKDIPKIAQEVKEVADGNKKWADVMDHTEISAQNLTKALILASSAGGGNPPKAAEVFKEMSQLFKNMGDDADSMNKKLEIVQKTMGAGFRAGQASAAQTLAVLERGPEALEKFKEEADKFSHTSIGFSAKDVESLKDFNSAWAQLDAALDQVKGHLAGIIAVPLTSFLEDTKKSLQDEKGELHGFAEGGSEALNSLIEMFKNLVSIVTDVLKAFENLTGIDAKSFMAGIAMVIDEVNIGLDGMRGFLNAVVLSLGEVYAWYLKVTGQAKTLDEARKNSPLFQSGKEGLLATGEKTRTDIKTLAHDTLTAGGAKDSGAADTKAAAEKTDQSAQKLNESATKHGEAAAKVAAGGEIVNTGAQKLNDAASSIQSNASWAASALGTAATKLQDAASALLQAGLAAAKGNGSSPAGMATGGMIRGPGGPTEDGAGVFALSDGEFVMQAAAVRHYGAGLMEGLNSLAVGGFATGGMVGGARAAGVPTTGTSGPSSVLNLTIDGNHFNGLQAPASVASKLKTFAVTRQAASAGRMPSWAR